MASPSVTYTFTAGTTAQSSQVNTNFNDIISAFTDGTKDVAVAAIAGTTLTTTGNTLLGNTSGDSHRTNGVFSAYGDASTIGLNVSIANLVTIGASGGSQEHVVNGNLNLAAQGILKLNDTTGGEFCGIRAAGTTTSHTLVMPGTAPSINQYLRAGSSTATNLVWDTALTHGLTTTVTDADYTITDTDGFGIFLFSTGASTRTLTLPTAANNTNRVFYIKKTDSGAGKLTVSGTIDGVSGFDLNTQNMFLTLSCNGTNYQIIAQGSEEASVNLDNNFTGGALKIIRTGKVVTVITTSAATHGSSSAPASSSGLVPAWARPAADKSTLYTLSASAVSYVAVGSNGTFQTIYRDWAGTLITAVTAGSQITLSYVV